jgi:hypothetical protein
MGFGPAAPGALFAAAFSRGSVSVAIQISRMLQDVIMRNITLNGGGGCAVSSFIWRARSAGFRARSAKCVPCRLDAAGSLGTAKAAADRIIPTDRSGYQCGQSGAPKILHHIAREPFGVWGQASPWGFIRQKCIAGRATRPPCSNATSHSGG